MLGMVPVALAVVMVAGCASSDDSLDQATAATLQSAVVQVADHASAGDTTGALASLDQLQASLDAAEAAGTITADRAQVVQQNIDLVRSDLQPAGETTTPEETTAPETVSTDPAPSEETTPAEETAPSDESDDKGPGGDKPNKGPGNNNGNGNGKGGGPGKK